VKAVPSTEADSIETSPEIESLLQGAIDMHVHADPSPFPRRITIVDAARQAGDEGFRAIVVKDHHQSMQPTLLALQRELPSLGCEVFAGVALNATVGGLNPHAAELALKTGGRVVWMPTISSRAHLSERPHGTFPRSGTGAVQLMAPEPITILDENGEILDVVVDIVDVVAEADAILNTGHLGADEIEKLIPLARERGVQRIVVSHPNFIVGAPPERIGGWVEQGAPMEYCLNMVLSGMLPVPDLLRYIEVSGADATIFSSDLGQASRALPIEAFRHAVQVCLDEGLDEKLIQRFVRDNAESLLFG